jgi:hypothetical protein
MVRLVLEFLGFVQPDRTRREPVALPAWSRRAFALMPIVLMSVSAVVVALLRALLT